MAYMSSFDILIFDMEDALVDQSSSLGDAISRSVDIYMTRLLGVSPDGGPLFTPEEIRELEGSQTFDEDVDLFKVLVAYAMHLLPDEIEERDFIDYDGRDLLEAVKNSGRLNVSLGDLVREKRTQELAKWLRTKGGGSKGFARLKLRNQWLVLSEGHMMMDNFVKRILAEVYLGAELFLKEYGQERQLVDDDAVIGEEKGWIEPDDLGHLRKRSAIAVVTSRSQAEAQYVLDSVGLGSYVDVVVSQDAMGIGMATLEEVQWVRDLGVGGAHAADYGTRIIEAVERVRAQEGLEQIARIAYVGDCSREGRNMQSLKERYRINIVGVTFGGDRKQATAQREKGADHVAVDPQHLLKILTERARPRSVGGYQGGGYQGGGCQGGPRR